IFRTLAGSGGQYALRHRRGRVELGVTCDEETIEIAAHSEEPGDLAGVGARLHRRAEDDHIHGYTPLFINQRILYLHNEPPLFLLGAGDVRPLGSLTPHGGSAV